MKTLLFLTASVALSNVLFAQTNVPVSATTTNAPAVVRTNSAIVPVQRPEPAAQRRTDIVLKRAKDNPGECDIVFIGDSITQGWEDRSVTNLWQKYYGSRKVLNFGVGGDKTQHVLWRFEQGQLDGLKPKVAVLLIGTNNSRDGDNTEAEILAGVKAIISQVRERLPGAKLLLLGIFPRGDTFSAQRGRLLEINQVLAKLDDGKTIRYLDFGSQLIEPDGSLPRTGGTMRDALHLNARGYEIWGEAIEPTLKEWLGK